MAMRLDVIRTPSLRSATGPLGLSVVVARTEVGVVDPVLGREAVEPDEVVPVALERVDRG